MRQIIGLGVLFDMSHASLSERAASLAQAGKAETDKGKALAKSLKGIETSS